MASRLGDQTARLQGRITLNPLVHIDPIGTLLFPALVIFGPLIGFSIPFMLVGWAKPTPVITRNFKKIVRDDNLVTLAGPVSNLLLVAMAFAISGGHLHCGSRRARAGARESVLARWPSAADCSRWSCWRCWPLKSTCRSSSSTCCPFRRSMAAAWCAICCPTTRCSLRPDRRLDQLPAHDLCGRLRAQPAAHARAGPRVFLAFAPLDSLAPAGAPPATME